MTENLINQEITTANKHFLENSKKVRAQLL